jgi:ribosomal protein S18
MKNIQKIAVRIIAAVEPIDYQNQEVKKLLKKFDTETKGMTPKQVYDLSEKYPKGSLENRLLISIWADVNGTPGF